MRMEMVEDWDLRKLASCLLEGEEGQLVVRQKDMLGSSASKDQDKDKEDMSTSYKLDKEDNTVLVITHRVGQVVAERKFKKCKSRIF